MGPSLAKEYVLFPGCWDRFSDGHRTQDKEKGTQNYWEAGPHPQRVVSLEWPRAIFVSVLRAPAGE